MLSSHFWWVSGPVATFPFPSLHASRCYLGRAYFRDSVKLSVSGAARQLAYGHVPALALVARHGDGARIALVERETDICRRSVPPQPLRPCDADSGGGARLRAVASNRRPGPHLAKRPSLAHTRSLSAPGPSGYLQGGITSRCATPHRDGPPACSYRARSRCWY